MSRHSRAHNKLFYLLSVKKIILESFTIALRSINLGMQRIYSKRMCFTASITLMHIFCVSRSCITNTNRTFLVNFLPASYKIFCDIWVTGVVEQRHSGVDGRSYNAGVPLCVVHAGVRREDLKRGTFIGDRAMIGSHESSTTILKQ